MTATSYTSARAFVAGWRGPGVAGRRRRRQCHGYVQEWCNVRQRLWIPGLCRILCAYVSVRALQWALLLWIGCLWWRVHLIRFRAWLLSLYGSQCGLRCSALLFTKLFVKMLGIPTEHVSSTDGIGFGWWVLFQGTLCDWFSLWIVSGTLFNTLLSCVLLGTIPKARRVTDIWWHHWTGRTANKSGRFYVERLSLRNIVPALEYPWVWYFQNYKWIR